MQIPLNKFKYPDDCGKFGAIRKYDIHTGIDLYCDEQSEVFAIEDGQVINVVEFTGDLAGSPWWNSTKAVLVESSPGVICYGEVDPIVKNKQLIKQGQLLGYTKRVLKKDKGRPTCMLHLELYKHGTTNPIGWELNAVQPDSLMDPTFLVVK